ncbi:92261658-2041-4dfa-929b-3fb723fe9b48 [Sclerotinia trifoliorum]|uniref:92261658-2041-4dfa-929b-3fb723fe9b48 n=1 Tax=Sclerotinia trifoliorum TaxID=28548 RepID=A0A8H2ZLE2_9HELO|nr:92261658-2041-4dfa-929b-3fb723fe9b48 [Sclerotinia trifoliorum]
MTTIHRNPPFRAEHLGSLLRPAELLARRNAFEKNDLSQEELTRMENESINKVVELQKECGFIAISDGEYRRAVFWGTFFEELEGMTEIRNPFMDIFRPYVPDIAGFIEKGDKPGQSCLCTGKIKHTGKSTLVGQFEYLKLLVPQERWGSIKLTMIAPPWYHLRYKDGKAFPKEVYPSDEEYFSDISKAVSAELDILYEAGLRNVQFDDPNFAYFCSEEMLKGWEEDKSNTKTADELLDAYIKCYNDSIEKHTAKMHFGLHICRGNFMGSRHFSEGGYDRIATKLFRNLNVATYYLEYDTPRSGSFEPLLYLPHHKNVILGVITSKFPELEDKEEMKARVMEAADIVAKGAGQTRDEALRRLGVSPQCGFASHEEGNLVGWEDMKNKLLLVRSIADEIWPGEP